MQVIGTAPLVSTRPLDRTRSAGSWVGALSLLAQSSTKGNPPETAGPKQVTQRKHPTQKGTTKMSREQLLSRRFTRWARGANILQGERGCVHR